MTYTIPVLFHHGVFIPLKKFSLRGPKKFLISFRVSQSRVKAEKESREILKDRKQIRRLSNALKNLRKKNLLSHSDIFGHPQAYLK